MQSRRRVETEAPEAVSERRVHRRYALSVPVQVVLGHQAFRVEGLNVSVGGAAVRTSASPLPGDVVALLVEPTGGIPFEIEAEVIRVEGGVIGLRFLRLDKRALELLVEIASISPAA